MRTKRLELACAFLALATAFSACARRPPQPPPTARPPQGANEIEVTAHAFTSSVAETDAQPTLSASGRELRPGMRAIAVSPDLLAMGLGFGTRVTIDGLGEWTVLDRMADSHHRAIDLYMGNDREAAVRFGKRRVRMRWGGG